MQKILHKNLSQSYELHQNFYLYLLHLDQLKEFFHNLLPLTDYIVRKFNIEIIKIIGFDHCIFLISSNKP
ncbi:hypothetical protein BpHYR1_032547 [Brachionus plicatilis]|uniref:Uncharacterized protein n=1 Tax=Brachionus plicatilis TaxID=10195 RepID=A0A3M7SKN6_BRAPC|nr:hypothetical protein BpHYR1_032547 [Brachionus plicatilis]